MKLLMVFLIVLVFWLMLRLIGGVVFSSVMFRLLMVEDSEFVFELIGRLFRMVCVLVVGSDSDIWLIEVFGL